MRSGNIHPAFFVAIVSFMSLFLPVAAPAAPGGLDATFGTRGIAVHNISNVQLHKTLIQGDGKIILVGKRRFSPLLNQPEKDYLFIRRYTSTGQLDTIFNTTFKQGTGFDAEIGTDGKLVVFGVAPNTVTSPITGTEIEITSPIVWRYNTDGTIDTTFGTNGYTYINTIAVGPFTAMHVEVHNGLIVLAYTSRSPFLFPSTASHRITRISPSGSIDFTRSLPFVNDAYHKSFSMAIDHLTGDILAAGVLSSNFNAAIRRYTIDNAVVTGFGVNGEAEIPDCYTAHANELRPQDMEILPDGRILTHRLFQDSGGVEVARMTASGTPDQLCNVSFFPPAQFQELYVQPDGKFFFYVGIAAGSARYFPDGTFDVLLPNFTGRPGSAIQPDLKIVAAWTEPGLIRIERRLLF